MAMQTLTEAQLKQLPADLRKQVEAMQNTAVALAKAGEGRITLKVGEKGGISMNGFGRWPVTLYVDQWDRMFEWLKAGGFETFAQLKEASADKLKTRVEAAVSTNGNGNGNGKVDGK